MKRWVGLSLITNLFCSEIFFCSHPLIKYEKYEDGKKIESKEIKIDSINDFFLKDFIIGMKDGETKRIFFSEKNFVDIEILKAECLNYEQKYFYR